MPYNYILANIDNFPRLEGRTIVAVDHSESLYNLYCKDKLTSYIKIADVLAGCLVQRSDDVRPNIVAIFGTDVDTKYFKQSVPLGHIVDFLNGKGKGKQSNARKIIDWLYMHQTEVARLVIISDGFSFLVGTFMDYLQKYLQEINPNTYVYFVVLMNKEHSVFRKIIREDSFCGYMYYGEGIDLLDCISKVENESKTV